MRKIYYFLFLLAFSLCIPLQAQAEEIETIPSWEGTFCDKVTTNCMKIEKQGVATHNEIPYANIMFYNEKDSAFITEGDLVISAPLEAEIYVLSMKLSEDRKNISVKVHADALSSGGDNIRDFPELPLVGNYTRVE